jgi:hypothetical protein
MILKLERPLRARAYFGLIHSTHRSSKTLSNYAMLMKKVRKLSFLQFCAVWLPCCKLKASKKLHIAVNCNIMRSTKVDQQPSHYVSGDILERERERRENREREREREQNSLLVYLRRWARTNLSTTPC